MRTYFLFALVLASPVAFAGAFKCVGSDGSVTYSQTPCGGNAAYVGARPTVQRFSMNVAPGPALPMPAPAAPARSAPSAGTVPRCVIQPRGEPPHPCSPAEYAWLKDRQAHAANRK